MRRAAWEIDQRVKTGGPISLFWTEGARFMAKKMCWRLCEIAAEVYGGLAASLDMPVESFVRRTYRMLHTGNTMDINAIKSSRHYDIR